MRTLSLVFLLSLVSCTPEVSDDFIRVENTEEEAVDTEEEVVDTEEEVVEEEEEEVVEEEEEEPAPITYDECSGNIGDHPCNFEFSDQDGNAWNLWENTGTVMVVDFSTMWCGVCRSIAGDTQAHQDFYTNLGYDFLWVTVLVDDSAWGNPPDLTDIQDWTSTYGIIDAPVLMGDRSVIDTTAEAGIPIVSWPTFIIIDEEMRITYGLGGWSEQMITDELESVLGL